MKKLAIFMVSALAAMSFAASRIGPVTQYGQLQAGKNANGKGRIFGSCAVYKDYPIQVKGMSLYWSLLPDATEFWTAEAVSTMVSSMNIQVIRAAMATGNEDWGGDKGYASNPNGQKNYVNTVVQAAIDNDIYVIIDWHSHEANNQLQSAKGFFEEMAQKWGSYDNVIFEVFNEPIDQNWDDVKSYADDVVKVIRKYSDNLILVGNPKWSSTPNSAVSNPVTDSGNNLAYTFHYYAGTHDPDTEGLNAVTAMNRGLSVFVSEWGTGTADGKGDPSRYGSANTNWQTWMDKHQLSWANWSASKIGEGTAAFSGGNRYSLSYSTSGNMVKGYLSSNPSSYVTCDQAVLPSSSSAASSSSARSSSSYEEEPDAIGVAGSVLRSVTLKGRTLQIVGAGPVSVDLFDMQGRLMARFGQVSGAVGLEKMAPGRYILQVRSDSGVKSGQIVLK